ncbi:F-box/kelch-repeat protein-like protein [Tanacetum coccineum]
METFIPHDVLLHRILPLLPTKSVPCFMCISKESYKIHWQSTLGLFYSSCEDDYKLVSIISHNNVQIYSLKSDSWRTIAFQDTSKLKRDRLSQGTCLNENLYFLNDDDKFSVTKFDTKTETFTEMKIPLLNDVGKSYHATLMVQKGCIHVFIMYDVVKKHHEVQLIELLNINEEGNWKKMETYRVDQYCMGDMKPLHLTRNGNLLMLGFTSKSNFNEYYGNKGYIYNIDLKKNKMKKKKPWKGIGKGKERLEPIAKMRITQIVRYIETFVSPNQYISNSIDHHTTF